MRPPTPRRLRGVAACVPAPCVRPRRGWAQGRSSASPSCAAAGARRGDWAGPGPGPGTGTGTGEKGPREEEAEEEGHGPRPEGGGRPPRRRKPLPLPLPLTLNLPRRQAASLERSARPFPPPCPPRTSHPGARGRRRGVARGGRASAPPPQKGGAEAVRSPRRDAAGRRRRRRGQGKGLTRARGAKGQLRHRQAGEGGAPGRRPRALRADQARVRVRVVGRGKAAGHWGCEGRNGENGERTRIVLEERPRCGRERKGTAVPGYTSGEKRQEKKKREADTPRRGGAPLRMVALSPPIGAGRRIAPNGSPQGRKRAGWREGSWRCFGDAPAASPGRAAASSAATEGPAGRWKR